MKRLKVVLLCFSLVALMLTSVACAPKLTSKQTMEQILNQSLKADHLNASLSGTMGMEVPKAEGDAAPQDPTTAGIMDMFKNIKFKMKLNYNKTDQIGNVGAAYDIDMNGMAMHLDFFYDDEKLVMKYPLMPQYMVLKTDDLISEINTQAGLELTKEGLIQDYKSLATGWYPDYVKAYMQVVTDDQIEMVDNYEFNVDGKVVKSKALKIKFTPDLMKASNQALFDSIVNSQTIYDLVKKYDTQETLSTFEDYQSQMKEMFASLNMSLEDPEVVKMYENMDMTYVLGYDKAYNMRFVDMKATISIDDPSLGQYTMNMAMAGEMTYEAQTITYPELTDTNQIDVIDMFNEQMGGLDGLSGLAPTDSSADSGTLDYPEDPYFDMQLEGVTMLAEQIAQNNDPQLIEGLLKGYFTSESPEMVYVYFAGQDKSMTMVPATEMPSDYDPTLRPFYTEAVAQKLYIEEPYQDAQTGRMIQTISMVVELNGQVLGVVGVDYFID